MSLHAPHTGTDRLSVGNLSLTERTDMSGFRAIVLLAVDDTEPSEYAFNCEYAHVLYGGSLESKEMLTVWCFVCK